MQKAVVAEKSQKPEKADKTLASSISAAKMSVLSVPIKNAPGSPLVINAFSAKAREAMRAAQEAGSAGKNNQPLKKVLATPDLAVARLQQLSADVGRARQRLREFRMLLPGEVADAIDASLEASERAIVGAAERRQASTGAAA